MPDSPVAAPSAAPTSTPTSSAPVTTKAPAAAAPASPAAPTGDSNPSFAKRQYKGKVDKEERVWELSDEEVSVRLQKSESAEKRFQQAAEIQKKWDLLRQIAKEDPDALFRELAGVDPQEWAQRKVEEKWKLEVMPEHERKVYELEQKIKAYEAGETKRQATLKAQQEQQASKALEAQLESDFQRAFEVSGLEYTADNLEVFGQLVLAAHDNGLEYTPEQLAAEAKSRLSERDGKHETRIKTRLTGLKGSELLDYLGEAAVKEVLKAAVAKHTSSLASVATPAALPANGQGKGPSRDEKGKFLTTSDWRKSFKTKL